MSAIDSDEDPETKVTSLTDAFQVLSNNAKVFYVGKQVPEEEKGPKSPLHFYRDWVSLNRPVIFRKAITHWPAFDKWQSNDYFRQKIGDLRVTVSVTPTGYADSAVFHPDPGSDIGDSVKFLMPHEEEMTVNKFLDVIEDSGSHSGVHYIQKQNSNLTDEFSSLLEDTSELPWAREAFGQSPDAINFWMGDARAVTSTHKDPYENIYCVVRGYKDITLFPPTDLPWLRYRNCTQAKYERKSDGDFVIQDLPEMPEIPWIVVDPLAPDLQKYPEYKNANPLRLRLNAGDVLYLPSLWFHHLQQSHGCVAVNYWYDMDYDLKWNYFQFLSNVCKLSK